MRLVSVFSSSSSEMYRLLARTTTTALLLFLTINVLQTPRAMASEVRVAVLKFGTVNWVMDVVRHHQLDTRNGFTLTLMPFAGTQATKVAFQAKAADIVVTDWLWVSRQRTLGRKFVFIPYSTSVGAIMVPKDSPIKSTTALKGAKIGVAGGPLDKSWLIANAYISKTQGFDLRANSEQVFAAPPLLSRKAVDGELDAVLNYWHFSARLEAKGFRSLLDIQEGARALGASGRIPMIGFVMRNDWAQRHASLARGFETAVAKALEILRTSDKEWQRLRPGMRVKNDTEWRVLRDRFRAGSPASGAANRTQIAEDIAKLYAVLAAIGGEKLVGKGKTLAPGTVWRGHGN